MKVPKQDRTEAQVKVTIRLDRVSSRIRLKRLLGTVKDVRVYNTPTVVVWLHERVPVKWP
jgi:hypothetical protein